MKLSLGWIKQYVDIPALEPKKIAHQLTMSTAEVEGVERISRSVEEIVVGEITGVEPIDTGDAEKVMFYVTVNTGTETACTVCGAPNVRIGLKSAFAAPGTTIARNFTVREQKVYGRMSQGMLLSPLELGWWESHVGIMAFPENLEPGTELANQVPAEDFIIDVDNKTITHRPDLWGHYGFARELAALYNRELKPLAVADPSEWKGLDPFPLRIEDFESCPGYCCLDIGGLRQTYSPLTMQYLLLSIGLRPINLVVDLTNFIMCELGQPMHAFDGVRVRDVIVRPFGSKGTFRTLDCVGRDMMPEDLMICDHAGPIALAGIMGGEESEIKENTTRVLLESANFNPARIRRTSLRLNIRTDASMRFEKGQPPFNMALSIRRFVQLLKDAGQTPHINSQLTCCGDTGEEERILHMKTSRISTAIGMKIHDSRIVSILTSLGFECALADGDLRVKIPPYRSKRDISIPNDIIEEVARIYGYDNITPSMPDIEMCQYPFNEPLLRDHKIRRFLSTARGFTEVHTYTWYDDVWLKRINYDPGETLVIRNPAAENNTRIRRELMPNLLALVESNSAYEDYFALYEIGNVHYPAPDGREQRMHCAGIVYQSEKVGKLKDLFLMVKGVVEELFVITNAESPEFRAPETVLTPWQVQGAFMNIMCGVNAVGQIGCLTEKTLSVFGKGTQIIWFELNADRLSGPRYPVIDYEEIPVYPGSWMDFSIVADKTMNYNDLAGIVNRFSHPIQRSHSFLYLYDGKGLPDGKASYTFRFRLGHDDRTLTRDDLNEFHESFRAMLKNQGLSIRE